MHRDTPRHLRYASGYIELKLLNEAAEELERVAFEDRLVPEVLAVRLELGMAAGHWDAVVGIGRSLAGATPEHERGWIGWAYALRELGRIDEAREVLLQAEPLHGEKCALLHYNLACYYCLLGEFDTARECLRRACKMAPGFEKDALDDPDLRALWGEV